MIDRGSGGSGGSGDPAFGALEAAWAELMTAWSARIVAETRGEPFDPADYDDRRRAFDPLLAAVDPTALGDEERAGLACIRSALAAGDDEVPVAGVALADERRTPEDPAVATLRRQTLDAFAEASAAIPVGGATVDRVDALGRLAIADDPAERRAIFDALSVATRTIAGEGRSGGPYRRLLASSAERWARDGSMVDRNAVGLGLDPADFEASCLEILAAGRRVLATIRGDAAGPIEPWDYRYVVGEAERRLAPDLPVERLLPLTIAHLRSLGADPDALRIGFDIEPRPGRPPLANAFSIAGSPGPWVFATYTAGGLGALVELLHEAGHALHYAAIDTRPAFREPPASDNAFFETIADVVGSDGTEPRFLAHVLGVELEAPTAAVARHGSSLLDVCWTLFEIRLHRDPGLDPNAVWSEIVADGLGIEPHPETPWWAIRAQLIDGPGWLANYALSAIAASAIRARLREVRGDWSAGDPGWYADVSARLLRFGGSRTPASVISELLGGPLTAEPLLAELAAAT